MASHHHSSFGTDDVAGWDTVQPECFGRCRGPTARATPSIEGISPAPFRQMLPWHFRLVVDACRNDLHSVLPLRMLLPELLQFGHRLLARSTPGGPPLQHQHFAAKI